ncbi:hypothetical protein [Luteibacter yeojuensis]|uniref:Type 1 fimbrial protein n=1 Tax=Luteibacter yeojuensis TaxID=345309 RepID=A0A7X5QX60_9GAMM|nr:hypothetical protein [Luteibacter yeojuensis]NID17049.1 hypothetical protein [Luteibacter yeojuensis]
MHRAFVTAALVAGSLLAGIPPGFAAGGRIAFSGYVLEQPCPLREGRLDCPEGRRVDAVVRAVDIRSIPGPVHDRLLEYAVHRDASRPWRLTEVTYR